MDNPFTAENIDLAYKVAVLIGVAWAIVSGPMKANKKSVEDLEQKQTRHGERLTAIETVLKQAPSHNDLSLIHEKVNGVSDTVSTLSGTLKQIANNVRLLTEHHMGKNK